MEEGEYIVYNFDLSIFTKPLIYEYIGLDVWRKGRGSVQFTTLIRPFSPKLLLQSSTLPVILHIFRLVKYL